MYIFEIIVPGTWLDYDDPHWAGRINHLLGSLQSQFFEANLALNLFVEACPIPHPAPPADTERDVSLENWQRDRQRENAIRTALAGDQHWLMSWEERRELDFQVEVQFKREKWSNGSLPTEFKQKTPHLYARSFIYALDAFDKFLGALIQEDNIPDEVATYHTKLAEAFPDLRGVRNTTQHLEDRSRGLGAGKNPRPLELKPIQNEVINAPIGRVLVLNFINGSKYGCAMADGHYGEVDVSAESMVKLQDILQNILALFKWKGTKRHYPGA